MKNIDCWDKDRDSGSGSILFIVYVEFVHQEHPKDGMQCNVVGFYMKNQNKYQNHIIRDAKNLSGIIDGSNDRMEKRLVWISTWIWSRKTEFLTK